MSVKHPRGSAMRVLVGGTAVLMTIRAINLTDIRQNWPLATIRKLPAYAIGTVSTFWLIDRIWAFAA